MVPTALDVKPCAALSELSHSETTWRRLFASLFKGWRSIPTVHLSRPPFGLRGSGSSLLAPRTLRAHSHAHTLSAFLAQPLDLPQPATPFEICLDFWLHSVIARTGLATARRIR